MVPAAMYDAVNAIDQFGSVFQVSVPASEAQGASPEAAASEAAYDVLSSLIPQEQPFYDATLAESLANIPMVRPRPPDSPWGTPSPRASWPGGQTTARTSRCHTSRGLLRGSGGRLLLTTRSPGDRIGARSGRSPSRAPRSFCRLHPPLNSPAYAAALKMTESLGAKNSTTRTPRETQIGDFWAYDVAGMGPPPVHLLQIAQDIALQQHNTLDQNARLFALAGVAIGDAGIVTWDAKYKYDRWRPITAIRDANQDGNPATVADPTWTAAGVSRRWGQGEFHAGFPVLCLGTRRVRGRLVHDPGRFLRHG